MSMEQHKSKPFDYKTIRFSVATVSDSRTVETDVSGTMASESLSSRGCVLSRRIVCANDRQKILSAVKELLQVSDVVITCGGTGISAKDVTVEALAELFMKKLDGFGEAFRRLSWEEIGTAAIVSRAAAGITDERRLLACLPGSPDAIRLALDKIILPELAHIFGELRKHV